LRWRVGNLFLRRVIGQCSGELFDVGVAAVIAGLLDQDFGFFEMRVGFGAVAVAEGEAGGGEVVVGEVEPHAGASGDAEDFFEVVGRAAGEEAEGKIAEISRAT
jgi:hypothetical protein